MPDTNTYLTSVNHDGRYHRTHHRVPHRRVAKTVVSVRNYLCVCRLILPRPSTFLRATIDPWHGRSCAFLSTPYTLVSLPSLTFFTPECPCPRAPTSQSSREVLLPWIPSSILQILLTVVPRLFVPLDPPAGMSIRYVGFIVLDGTHACSLCKLWCFNLSSTYTIICVHCSWKY